jgi:radical SAM protein with 4Fe4S-binding SPASM domain
MRISNHIRILKGAKRYALYNFDRHYVEPISDLQAAIVKAVASGKRVQPSNFGIARILYSNAIGGLRRLDALRAGSPKHTQVDFPAYANAVSACKLDQVWLEITNSCNLTCSHCYSNSSPRSQRATEIDASSWKTIVDKLISFGTETFTLIGGEPLIRYRLAQELIEHIKIRDPKIRVNIFTNLTILPSHSDFVASLRARSVRVGTSLYGIEPTEHDSMTGMKGSWARTLSNIKNLRNAEVAVFAGYYKTANNRHSDPDIASFIERIGIFDYEILSPSQVGRGEGIEWKSQTAVSQLPTRKYFAHFDPYQSMHSHNCFAKKISITASGDVIPCIMARSVTYGNALHDDIEEIFQTELYNQYSSLSKDVIEGCRDCEFRYGCFDCRPDAEKATGNVFAKPDCGYSPDG